MSGSTHSPPGAGSTAEVPEAAERAEPQCERCADPLDDSGVNVEAFELSGEIVCSSCAEDVFEDNSQFGVGA